MFDETYKVSYEGTDVEYGCILGSSQIVYIKAGMGGSYLGYEDKYLKIAHRLNDKYCCSVICVSNPVPLPVVVDQMILGECIKKHDIHNHEMFFFGHSNGSIKGLALTEVGVAFEKMILVNMPLMINFHKTKAYLAAIPKTEIIAVYGELDPSFRYVPFLSGKFQNLNVLKILLLISKNIHKILLLLNEVSHHIYIFHHDNDNFRVLMRSFHLNLLQNKHLLFFAFL